MILNLPLLMVKGNPVALGKISTTELEKFIPFMLSCAWGHELASAGIKPPWWPKGLEFLYPFERPCEVPTDWDSRLRNIVKKCYEFHNSTFLLIFSSQLSRYPRNRLRYVDNQDHTTSLYYRFNGRLLATFRNSNLYYDNKNHILEDEEPVIKSADIYLCDTCDSHFDNLDILNAHGRLCNNDIPTSTCNGKLPDFLSALKLQPVGMKAEISENVNVDEAKPKSVRSNASFDRGPPYPFSSLAFTRNLKTHMQRDTSHSRERIERYCCSTTLPSKIVVNKSRSHFPVRYRRPIDYWNRKHVFPNQRNKKILDIKAQLLMLKCKPITVNITRMSLDSIQENIETLRKESERKLKEMEDNDIVYVDGLEFEQATATDVEMKPSDPLKRSESECEVIDLCSDDESEVVNENCDPRAAVPGVAGVACVMRGGAVLRRTAGVGLALGQSLAGHALVAHSLVGHSLAGHSLAGHSLTGHTPRALPAAPCGARHRPLPAHHTAVLQPHPVILIAHTLNNLQTISLD